MSDRLRVLMVEDSEDDALLLLRELKWGGYEPVHHRVVSGAAMRAALEAQEWDLILSDYRLPGFDGLRALRIYRETGLDIPFILVSGMVGEEVAVEAMRSGAHDYLMKDNLVRLIPAIRRELQEAEVRQARRQAEEALRASERNYRLLVQHAPSGIYELDLNALRFTSVNDVMCEYTGYTPEEFMELSPFDLLTDESKALFAERQTHMLLDQGVPETAEFKIKGKGGREFWVLLRSRVTQDGGKHKATVVVHDISDRKRVEEELQLYSDRLRVLRDIDKAILQAESTLTIAQAALRYLQRLVPHDQASVAQIDYQHGVFEIIAEVGSQNSQFKAGSKINLARLSSLIEQLVHGTARVVNDIEAPPGRILIDRILKFEGIRSYISAPLIYEDTLIGSLNIGSCQKNVFTQEHIDIAYDIANQLSVALRQAQLHEQVHQHAHELEQHVAERTQELQVANERLQALSRVKDEFVSNVSHELRTPIASLKMQSDILTLKPEALDKYLEPMRREIDRLEHLIEDLLSLSRLDQDRYAWNPVHCNLNELCKGYVADRVLLAANRQLSIRFKPHEELPFVRADRGLLGQVLSILLTNAINYSEPGGEILVSTQEQSDGDRVWAGLCVSDSGPGIPLEEQPRVFERFYRGKSGRDSNTSGTGLGLAIAREIVDRHHGRIEILSPFRDGRGTEIWVWLPVGDIE